MPETPALLAGRRMVVVGASAGIGRAVATSALDRGATVALIARRRDRLREVIAGHPQGVAIVADVREPDDCRRASRECREAVGAPDLLVYAAGVSPLVDAALATRDDWLRALEVNTIGAAMVFGAFVDFMAPRSVLAYLSSESVGSPRHGGMVYQASKAATEEAVRVLATEHPELRFTTIAVGATVGTEIGADRDPTLQARFATEWLRRGTIKRAFMEASQLGELIMAMLTPVVLYDAADVREIRIEPAGPIAPDLAAITAVARPPASESSRRVEGAS